MFKQLYTILFDMISDWKSMQFFTVKYWLLYYLPIHNIFLFTSRGTCYVQSRSPGSLSRCQGQHVPINSGVSQHVAGFAAHSLKNAAPLYTRPTQYFISTRAICWILRVLKHDYFHSILLLYKNRYCVLWHPWNDFAAYSLRNTGLGAW